MLFSSITFLYCFLPCVLLVYFVVPDRLKNFTLLAASLIFYGWGEPKYLVFMLATVTQSYIAALLIERFRASPSVVVQQSAFATGVPPNIYAFHRYTRNSDCLSDTQEK